MRMSNIGPLICAIFMASGIIASVKTEFTVFVITLWRNRKRSVRI